MTFSIVARDPETGLMGVATQTQALAVGASVPWALPGYGVIATQSMGEPMYGELGLDLLRNGLTATEALAALRTIDEHPDRRQVAMVDLAGEIAVYTGEDCVDSAGHLVGDCCAALANMVAGPDVWHAMVERYEATAGPMTYRLLAALRAGEDAGGDIRGHRSAAVLVVRHERTGRPWRDQLYNLRVDADPDPLTRLGDLVDRSIRYHRVVEAFEMALDGQATEAAELLDLNRLATYEDEPDLRLWRAVVLGLAGREPEAREILHDLCATDPAFVETLRRFGPAGLVPSDLLDRILPDQVGAASV
ncbi:MAG: DUF1028 domain-containing protein [Nitriliruptor sp.]|uniref:DUF1028 domain-containing protein n=1 Tax=Nitriliruptor sp. TaxID=2448056 RepID=UPI0034A0AC45